jgi:light-independent protochlorophyllide reductase subunit B
MFREDFEFHDGAAPSHLGSGHGHRQTVPEPQAAPALAPVSAGESTTASAPSNTTAPALIGTPTVAPEAPTAPMLTESAWAPEAEKELKKIPFFVRGKARRNTETFARERGIASITVETLYEAKAHFSR